MKLRNLIVLSILIIAYGLMIVSLNNSGQIFYLNGSSMSAFSSYTVLP